MLQAPFFLIGTSSEPGHPGQGSPWGDLQGSTRQPCIGHCGPRTMNWTRTHPLRSDVPSSRFPEVPLLVAIAPGPPPKPITVTPFHSVMSTKSGHLGIPVGAVYRPLFYQHQLCPRSAPSRTRRAGRRGASLHRGLGGTRGSLRHSQKPSKLRL